MGKHDAKQMNRMGTVPPTAEELGHIRVEEAVGGATLTFDLSFGQHPSALYEIGVYLPVLRVNEGHVMEDDGVGIYPSPNLINVPICCPSITM
ncbi:hypothetical protein BaRGS_00029907 [Batillaria attramentaria]|uniref:Uncharacterized protein n=1 Tax=Batillaria attramentaria TaxID=370345 RepID=A0ABD0JVC9_9CAEN